MNIVVYLFLQNNLCCFDLAYILFYLIGNVLLAFGQASVERRSMIPTRVRSIQPASTIFFYQRDKSTRLTAGSMNRTDLPSC